MNHRHTLFIFLGTVFVLLAGAILFLHSNQDKIVERQKKAYEQPFNYGAYGNEMYQYGDRPAQVPAEVYRVTFDKEFILSGEPKSLQLTIGADNTYEVYFNDGFVGKSESNESFSFPVTYDLTSKVKTGSNFLLITAGNRPTYSQEWTDNPAGLAYKIADETGKVIAASDGTEKIASSTSALGGLSIVLLNTPLSWSKISGAKWIWDPNDPALKKYLESP